MNLATRMHANPRQVISVYASGGYAGNRLDLFEPGHGPWLAPRWIDNQAFPADWFTRTSTCGRQCESCGYCRSVIDQVLVEPNRFREAV